MKPEFRKEPEYDEDVRSSDFQDDSAQEQASEDEIAEDGESLLELEGSEEPRPYRPVPPSVKPPRKHHPENKENR